MAAAKKPAVPDLALLIPEDDEMGAELPAADAPDEGSELPPGFMSAFEEMEAGETPEARAKSLYDAILACKAAHE